MANDNDFDEWIDDVDADDDGELDQLNIDALLSAVDDDAAPAASEVAASSELDQTNIDALLGISNNDAPEESDDMDELDQDNIDALLNGDDDIPDIKEEAASIDSDELDQDNIDALLSGDDNDDIGELDQDNIDALLGGSDESASNEELEQDNIDALLGGEDSEDLDELDQDNIDALLSSPDDTPPEAPESDDVDQSDIDELLGSESDAIAEDLAGDLGQDDLDELFAESSTPDTPEPESADSGDEVEQDDIDALFNDIDAATSDDSESTDTSDDQSLDELFAEDDGGDETTLSAEASDESAETAFDSEFDEMDQLFSELEDDSSEDDDPFQAEEIDFAEMLDSSSDDGEDEFLTLGDEEEEDEFAMAEDSESDGNETNIDALLSADDDEDPKEDEDDQQKKAFVIPAFITDMNKATMSAIGGTIALLLILGFYFMFSGGDNDDITVVINDNTTETNTAPTPALQDNFIPVVENTTYAMADDGGELAVELQAADEDDQPLIYEITSKPSHGRLSGTAPNFTYLANSDFPGEDSFEYTVNDGVDTSTTALVTITGPDLKGQALARQIAEESRQQTVVVAKEIKPKKPVVLAKNVHFYTDSTAPITINWRRIWKEANKSGYDPKIHVEIVKTETVGKLAKVTGSSTTFTPDPYSGGTDLIFYRFKKNGFRSATKTISIDISLGNPAPEINLAELQKGYPVGQNVFLDTAPSRDDTPESLQFTWEQISGSPVSLQILKDNGSRVVFVMPSSFYNKGDSGPTFMITATDQTGKITTREIKTNSISRRQAALWRGSNGGVAESPALKGQYFPWPYDE